MTTFSSGYVKRSIFVLSSLSSDPPRV